MVLKTRLSRPTCRAWRDWHAHPNSPCSTRAIVRAMRCSGGSRCGSRHKGSRRSTQRANAQHEHHQPGPLRLAGDRGHGMSIHVVHLVCAERWPHTVDIPRQSRAPARDLRPPGSSPRSSGQSSCRSYRRSRSVVGDQQAPAAARGRLGEPQQSCSLRRRHRS